MRILIILMVLLAAIGCSPKPPTEHHILPVGFSGVYKIEKVQSNSGDYKVDGTRYIFTIPESGVVRVASDVYETVCIVCKELTASFADGQNIPLFSPISQPPDSESDRPLLLGLFLARDAIWYAVGTHEQLSRFLEQVRLEKYQELERYLPPNTPFQADEEAGSNS